MSTPQSGSEHALRRRADAIFEALDDLLDLGLTYGWGVVGGADGRGVREQAGQALEEYRLAYKTRSAPVSESAPPPDGWNYSGDYDPENWSTAQLNKALQEEAQKPHPAVTLHAVGARVLCEHRLIPQLNYPQSEDGYECEKCGMLFVPYVPVPRELTPAPAESTADPEEAFSGRGRS